MWSNVNSVLPAPIANARVIIVTDESSGLFNRSRSKLKMSFNKEDTVFFFPRLPDCSLVSQCHQRIDFGRSPRRYIARHQSHRDQQPDHGCERRRIVCVHTINLV